jgi:hypothetical protein
LDSLTLAWSDPVCVFNPYGLLQGNGCSISTGVEGFESQYATQANLNGKNIAFTGPSKFIFNGGSGNGIAINGGGVISQITGGAALEQGYLCIADLDGDGFPSDFTRYKDTSATCDNTIADLQINARRVRDMVNPDMLDCYDNNANAKPGQTAWFTTNRGDGSYDYDCNGSSQPYYTLSYMDYGSNTCTDLIDPHAQKIMYDDGNLLPSIGYPGGFLGRYEFVTPGYSPTACGQTALGSNVYFPICCLNYEGGPRTHGSCAETHMYALYGGYNGSSVNVPFTQSCK